MFNVKKSNKGVFQPGLSLEKLEKNKVAIPVSSPIRKSVRYRCMRIRNKNWTENDGLKELIEQQFDSNMNWDNFNVVWDIDKKFTYKVARLCK